MEKWKNQFKPAILEKGYDLYANQQVVDLVHSETGIDAVVEGDEMYDVEIFLKDHQIINMVCTCPYADEGNTCKHMAAVLYAFEKRQDTIPDYRICAQPVYANDSVSVLIDEMDEEELKTVLKDAAAKNEELAFEISLKKRRSISEQLFNSLKEKASSIGDRLSDDSGYIDYRNASDYGLELSCFLQDYPAVMIEYGCSLMAFELVCAIFLNIAMREMDDSSGESTLISEECYQLWKRIVEQCTDSQRNTIRKWFKMNTSGQLIDYMEDVLVEFLEHELHDRALLKRTLEHCDRKIQDAEGKTDCGRIYSDFAENNVILRRIETMTKLGCSAEEISLFKSQHRQFYVLREMEIMEALENQDDKMAMELLQASKKMDAAYPEQMRKYHELLIELYERNHLKTELMDECKEYLYSIPQKDLKAVTKLKENMSASEWDEEVNVLYSLPSVQPIRYELLQLEGKYTQMISEINTLPGLDRFRFSLMKHAEKECCIKYCQLLDEEAKYSTSRNGYAYWAQYLKMIADTFEGYEMAQHLASSWKKKYVRRYAMMEELKKAGF